MLAAVALNTVGPSPGLLRAAWWLLVAGACGTVLGLPLLVVEGVFIGRLVWQCRAVVRTAAPSRRDDSPSLDLSDLTELGNVDFGGPSLPTFDADNFGLSLRLGFFTFFPGGAMGVYGMLGLVAGTVLLMVGPMVFCLLRPQMIGQVLMFAVLLVIYVAVHLPLAITMLLTLHRTGYGLNYLVDTYRLYEVKVPWAPVTVGFWTVLCGMLLMAGPFSLAFFILLALWAHRTSVAAARICDADVRERIATPLPPKASEKTARADVGAWSGAKG